jgi:hypothetical protein
MQQTIKHYFTITIQMDLLDKEERANNNIVLTRKYRGERRRRREKHHCWKIHRW